LARSVSSTKSSIAWTGLSFGWLIYRLHQELIELRRQHPWLHKARSRVTELRNTDFTFEAFHEENRLWVR
jgi:cyclomaltodextrinase